MKIKSLIRLTTCIPIVGAAMFSRCDESQLLATSNLWGRTSTFEYEKCVFAALAGTNRQVVASDELRGWFTNMVAYPCSGPSFEIWLGEKKLMLDVGIHYAEIAKSLDCWLSVADLYNSLKVAKENFSVGNDSGAQLSSLTNGNMTAFCAAIKEEKSRIRSLRAVNYVIPGVSNIVLHTFPSSVLPSIHASLLSGVVSNVVIRADMASAEAAVLETYILQ